MKHCLGGALSVFAFYKHCRLSASAAIRDQYLGLFCLLCTELGVFRASCTRNQAAGSFVISLWLRW
jgi:hypothetical protein